MMQAPPDISMTPQSNKIDQLFLRSDYQRAAKLLVAYLDRQPSDVDSLMLLGFAYEQEAHVNQKGKRKTIFFGMARNIFGKVERLGERAKALRGYGTISLHKGRFSEAYTLYKKSCRLDSRDEKTLVALGNAARQLRQFKKALSWYEKYRRRRGGGWQLFTNEAFTAHDAGMKDFARRRAIAALKSWPRSKNPKLVAMRRRLREITAYRN